jgi:hypothetical protein
LSGGVLASSLTRHIGEEIPQVQVAPVQHPVQHPVLHGTRPGAGIGSGAN